MAPTTPKYFLLSTLLSTPSLCSLTLLLFNSTTLLLYYSTTPSTHTHLVYASPPHITYHSHPTLFSRFLSDFPTSLPLPPFHSLSSKALQISSLSTFSLKADKVRVLFLSSPLPVFHTALSPEPPRRRCPTSLFFFRRAPFFLRALPSSHRHQTGHSDSCSPDRSPLILCVGPPYWSQRRGSFGNASTRTSMRISGLDNRAMNAQYLQSAASP